VRPQSLRIRKQWIAVCRQYSKIDRPRVVSTNPVLATRACVRTISCPLALVAATNANRSNKMAVSELYARRKNIRDPLRCGPSRLSAANGHPWKEGVSGQARELPARRGGPLGQPRRPELKVGGVYASTKFHKQGSSRNNSAPSSPRITYALQITCRRLDENSGRRTWTEIEANTRFKSNLFAFFLQTERSRKGAVKTDYSRREVCNNEQITSPCSSHRTQNLRIGFLIE
jgi:hypothetical protein